MRGYVRIASTISLCAGLLACMGEAIPIGAQFASLGTPDLWCQYLA